MVNHRGESLTITMIDEWVDMVGIENNWLNMDIFESQHMSTHLRTCFGQVFDSG